MLPVSVFLQDSHLFASLKILCSAQEDAASEELSFSRIMWIREAPALLVKVDLWVRLSLESTFQNSFFSWTFCIFSLN